MVSMCRQTRILFGHRVEKRMKRPFTLFCCHVLPAVFFVAFPVIYTLVIPAAGMTHYEAGFGEASFGEKHKDWKVSKVKQKFKNSLDPFPKSWVFAAKQSYRQLAEGNDGISNNTRMLSKNSDESAFKTLFGNQNQNRTGRRDTQVSEEHGKFSVRFGENPRYFYGYGGNDFLLEGDIELDLPLPVEKSAFNLAYTGLFCMLITVIVSAVASVLLQAASFGAADKEQSKMRDLMRLIGVRNASLVLASILEVVAVSFLPSVVFAICVASSLVDFDFVVPWVTCWLVFMQASFFGCFLGTVIPSKTVNTWVGISVHLCGMLLGTYRFMHQVGASIDFGYLWPFILLTPHGSIFGMACTLSSIAALDEPVGFQSLTFNKLSDVLFYPRIIVIWVMVLVSCFMWILLTIYLELVLPKDFGLTLPPGFFWSRTYWKASGGISEDKNAGEHLAGKDVPLITCCSEHAKCQIERASEPVPEEVVYHAKKSGVYVSMLDLEKKYGQHVAVDGVTTNIYCNQILGLLGHNGAGKTTLVNILSGMVPLTGGNAYVAERCLKTDVSGVQEIVGVCPQHDVLLGDFTPREHLVLWIQLQNGRSDHAENEVEEILKTVDLLSRADTWSKNLSGGQRRKLSLAIASIGNRKVCFFDEPTTGLDPLSRSRVWEGIKKIKQNRAIVLTTHFMEEAEYLSDRVAIMAKGKLLCCGSPFFLKSRFGAGYELKVSLVEPSQGFANLLLLVQKYIPEAQVSDDDGHTITVRLPDSSIEKFGALFEELDQRPPEANVSTYGINIISLEEIFVKLTNECGESHGEVASINVRSSGGPERHNCEQATGFRQIAQQTKTTTIRRLKYSLKDPSIWCGIVFCPIVTFLMMLTLGSLFSKSFSNSPPELQDWVPEVKPLVFNYDASLGKVEDTRFEWVDKTASVGYRGTLEFFGIKYINGKPSTWDDDVKTDADDEDEQTHWDFLQNHASKIFDAIVECSLKQRVGVVVLGPLNGKQRYVILDRKKKQWITEKGGLYRFGSGFDLGATILKIEKPKLEYIRTGGGQNDDEIKRGGYSQHFLLDGYAYIACFALFPAGIFIGSERSLFGDDAYNLQVLSGLKQPVFWLSNWLLDVIFVSLATAFYTIILALFSDMFRSSASAIDARQGKINECISDMIILFAFLHPIGGVSFIYLCVGRFPRMKYTVPLLQYQYFNLWKSVMEALPKAATSVIGFFLDLFPTFAALSRLTWSDPLCRATDGELFGTQKPGTKYPAELFALCFIVIAAFAYLFAIVVWDLLQYGSFKCAKRNDFGDDFTVDIVKVTKRYDKTVVDKVSLHLARGERFALLGVNGAGKTTLIKMMLGLVAPSEGRIYVDNHDMASREVVSARSKIGYCPQDDKLFEDSSLRASLWHYARLKRIPRINAFVTKAAHTLGYGEHLLKVPSACSGGTRRKASLTVAVMGNPVVALLDEPTSGVDPHGRRRMWELIKEVSQRSSTTIVLTTHVMEDAEAFCDRIAIMVSGQFVCLGTSLELQSRYANGLTLIIRYMEPSIDQLRAVFDLPVDAMISAHMVYENLGCGLQIKELAVMGDLSASAIRDILGESADVNSKESDRHIDLETVSKCILRFRRISRTIECLRHRFPNFEFAPTIDGASVKVVMPENVGLTDIFNLVAPVREELHIAQFWVDRESLTDVFNKFAESQEAWKQALEDKNNEKKHHLLEMVELAVIPKPTLVV